MIGVASRAETPPAARPLIAIGELFHLHGVEREGTNDWAIDSGAARQEP